jgi:hypothetical protein
MNARRVLVVLFLGGLAFSSSSCGPPKPIICPPGYVFAPTLLSPPNLAYTTDTTPPLSWKYKGYAYPYPQPEPTPWPEYKCLPNKFRVSLSTAPLFLDDLGATLPGAASTTWNTPPLQSGRTYRWSVVAISKGQQGPPSQERFFSVGGNCASVSDLSMVSALMPPNDATVDTLTPEVLWSPTYNKMTCLPKGYVIQYSHSSNFGAYEWVTGIGPGSGYYMKLPPLENCTTYYWRVAAHLATSVNPQVFPSPTGPYGDAFMFHVALGGKCLIQPQQPQELATLPPGPIPPVDKLWKIMMNANCRGGPGTNYNEKGFAPKGFSAKIEGRNEDGMWFRLIDAGGTSCWVSKIALEVPADWESLPVLGYPAPPPPPKPQEENPNPPADPCAQYQGAVACLEHPECSFNRYTGACVSR